jgi:tRNA-dihydrouridine synthase B
MRIIARRLGAPYALHQVLLDKSICHSEKVRRRLLPPLRSEDRPVGGQLMGADASQIAPAAEELVRHGCDVIDVNFGCPVPKVLGRKRGGYLLSDPPTAIEIMRAVRHSVPPQVPVTLKLRSGMDESPESERSFLRVFDAALEIGLDAITVHPRTVRQRYRGSSDWGFLARIKRRAADRVILGSGDLFTAQLVKRMFEQTGVDGVSIARGCIGNPWIFSEARALLAGQPLPPPPSVPEQRRVIIEHFALSVAEHGERLAVRILRKFGIKYAELHPHHKEVRAAFVAAMDRDAWLDVLDRWYDPHRPWPPGRRKQGPGELIAAGACP